jgi:GNAT superfamily N-acetyltransferase
MTTLTQPLLHRAAQGTASAWRIRRVNGGDVVAMQRFVEALSEGGRRRRFHGAVKGGSALAAALVQGDAVWAAFHGRALIGEARFVRDHADPGRAELAMAVADGWQGRGVATALLKTLLADASRAGVHVLRADVMCDNAPMQRFLQRHGFVPRLQWECAADSDIFERQLVAQAPWHRLAAWLRLHGASATRPPSSLPKVRISTPVWQDL